MVTLVECSCLLFLSVLVVAVKVMLMLMVGEERCSVWYGRRNVIVVYEMYVQRMSITTLRE